MNKVIKKLSDFLFLNLIIFSFFSFPLALGETQFIIKSDLNSLLYTAVKNGKDVLTIEALIKNGADVNAKNDQGHTSLHTAARYNTADVVRTLLEAGADVNAKNHQGYTPLYEVAYNTNEKDAKEIARVLLEAGEGVMNVRSYYGSTPFHWAARYGTLAFVKVLIEAGADINAKDLKGYTPLHLASESNTETIVKAILKAGADVNVKADNGRTPLHLAAASNSRLAVVNVLLEARANINTKDKNKQTPLHLAAKSNTGAIVETLLASTANKNVKDEKGYTPFYRAVADNTNKMVIEVFILNGADVKARINNGWTALHVAARHNKEPDILKTLIKAGANVNTTDQEGWTPLHIAARYNTVSVVEALIQNGADVNVKGNFGSIDKDWEGKAIYSPGTQGLTPLHWAAENDTKTASDIVRALIEAGADVNAETEEDKEARIPLGGSPRTPLALAVCYNIKTVLGVVETLLKAGASVNELTRYCIGSSNLKGEFRKTFKQVVLELKELEMILQDAFQSRQDAIRALEEDGFSHEAARLKAETRPPPPPPPIPKEWASFSWADIEKRFRGGIVKDLMRYGWTPSRWARKYTPERRLAILKVFLQFQYVSNMEVGLSNKDITGILHVAVRDNKTTGDFVKILIQNGANVNTRNKDGQTPLHIAAHYNTTDVVRVLFEAGADINAKNKYGFTPLVSAMSNKEAAAAIVKIFIEKEADVNATCTNSTEDARKAYDAALYLYSSHHDVGVFLPDEFTILHIAAGYSTKLVVKALLEAGANVHARDTDGKTPLHMATRNTADVVRALLEAEADVNVKANNGQTPLHLVAAGQLEKIDKHGQQDDILSFLDPRMTTLEIQEATGHRVDLKNDAVTIMKVLLKAGTNVNAKDIDGKTPLHMATRNTPVNVVRVLLEAGASVHARDIDERTPLHVAIRNFPLDKVGVVVKTLLEAGASVHARDVRGRTPLHVATRHGKTGAVRALLEAGANVHARNREGWLPLHGAIGYFCFKDIIAILIQNGASMDEVVKRGNKRNESPRQKAQRVGCSWE